MVDEFEEFCKRSLETKRTIIVVVVVAALFTFLESDTRKDGVAHVVILGLASFWTGIDVVLEV